MAGKRGENKTRPVGWLRCDEIALARLYPDSPDWLLARVFGRSESSIVGKAAGMGLHKSAAYKAEHSSCFRPGQVPANKGVKRPGFAPGNMAKTQFKKGQLNGRAAQLVIPVGGYRINPDGYVEQKFSDEPGPYTRRWKPVHRQVWEAAHGPIPEGHVVAFLPGCRTTDPEQITLDKLELASQVEMMRRNTLHNLPKPLAKLIQLRGALNRQINKRSNSQ